jgi:integration host factor subunit beta
MATITKKDIIDRIVDRTNAPRAIVRTSVQEFLDQVIQELRRGNRLEFRDFGVFELRRRAARVAQNPKTLQKVTVPPKVTVKFKVGRLMRESLEKSEAGKDAAKGSPAVVVKTNPSKPVETTR